MDKTEAARQFIKAVLGEDFDLVMGVPDGIVFVNPSHKNDIAQGLVLYAESQDAAYDITISPRLPLTV